MAIAGFLVHAEAGQCERLEMNLAEIPGISTFGIHRGYYLVAVAEAPGDSMEDLLHRVHCIDGVLAVYVTSMTVEDEIVA
ncbi:MAG: chaperone NapD [Desulfovibrio sp.]|jgi:nitrate reductase NapAB chaperone NapD|nr:chaperone NapD [Desulfovibrio sp.]